MAPGLPDLLLYLVVMAGLSVYSSHGAELKFTSSPEYITLLITSESFQSELHLRRNTLLDDQPSLHRVQDDGQITEETVDDTKSCLYASESDDVVSLTLTQHVHHDTQLWLAEGFLELNGTEYLLVPSDKIHTALLDHTGTRTGVYNLLQTKGVSVEKVRIQMNVSMSHRSMRKMKRATKTEYRIELGIFVAYDIYQAWVTKGGQMNLLHAYPSRNIRQFYYHIATMIDKIFQTIQDPDFEVRVVLNKLFYSPTRESSSWTETSRRGNDINLAMALVKFSEDMRSKRSAGNTGYDFDTIILFTGYPVTGSKTGASYLGQICDAGSASVVSAGLDFTQSVLRSAHEIGHSVGMFHDGDRNRCRPSDCYNMASQITSSGQCKFNVWRFSSCSVDYFRSYVSRAGTQNCLLKNTRRNYSSQWRSVRNKLYGQHYGPHEQCKIVEHPDSYLCQNVMKDINNICSEMLCFVPSLNQCRYLRPAAGTPCGNTMMCSSGRCVQDWRAKTVDMSCPYGDHQYEIFVGWTCQGLEKAGYLSKYNMCNSYPTVREKCCQTCKKYPRVYY